MRRALGVFLAFASAGCANEPLGVVTPGEGLSSGYVEVRIDVERANAPPDGVRAVRFGERLAIDLEPLGPDAFEVLVQGAPSAGPVDVVIETGDQLLVIPEAFQYEPARSDRFERVVAIGASLGQGVQNGVPSFHGGLMSPPAQLARQLGGDFPLPLLVRDALSPIAPSDIGPPPDCLPPDVAAHLTEATLEALSQEGAVPRMDPGITASNLAVAGAKVKTILEGPAEDDALGQLFARWVYRPSGADPVASSQVQRVEEHQPTLVVSADLMSQDVAAALLGGADIDASLVTPLDDLTADLTDVIGRLTATGALIFVANLPAPSHLPLTEYKRRRMIRQAVAEAEAAGSDPVIAAEATAQAADEAIAAIDGHAVAMNAALAELADQHGNVHVVDLAATIDEAAEAGVSANGQLLTTRPLGGLFSLDGIHFTDAGYAVVANVFVDSINAELGTAVPRVDLDRVADDDPSSPKAIAAAGLDVSLCAR